MVANIAGKSRRLALPLMALIMLSGCKSASAMASDAAAAVSNAASTVVAVVTGTPTPTPTPSTTTPSTPTPTPATSSGNAAPIGQWRERILNADGTINQAEYKAVAANYNSAEMMEYRLGPKAADFGNATNTALALWGPDLKSGQGLWPSGILPANNPGEPEKCLPPNLQPRSDPEELNRGLKGGGWLVAGQHIFVPDNPNDPDFKYGISNTRGADGAYFDTGGLCMRMIVSWYPDWWNRNNIATPAQPEIRALAAKRSDLPLVPVAIARGRANASQISYAAFRDGTITPIKVGNFAPGKFDATGVRLPAGMVPTAMAVTPYNEFLVVAVWDTNTVTGKLAFIALRPFQMANGGGQVESALSRNYWGFPGAWELAGMKLIGMVDLPFAAPNSLDVSNHVVLGNPRGHSDNDSAANGNLALQATRDKWAAVTVDETFGPNEWRQSAQAGYAIVASRAENKVSFVDMGPLYQYYRKLYLTTQANFNLTTTTSLTDGNLFPFSFDAKPEQKPVIAATLTIERPTSVSAGVVTKGVFGVPRAYDLNEDSRRSGGQNIYSDNLGRLQAYVATMSGDVLFFDVSRINLPGTNRTVPSTPIRTVKVGRNPTFLYTNGTSTKPDDLFLVSRGDRTVSYIYPNGRIVGTLRDSRLIDPVGGAVSINQAGFGGNGAGKAVAAHTINITDYNGKAIHTYAVDPTFAASWKQPYPELYPFTTPTGYSPFLWGSTAPFPGKPFMIDQEEII